MHNKGVLHRDIQLGNCVVGLPPNEKMIYMIDFGFGKQYIDPRTGRHIPDSKVKRDFIGNYWFSSIGVHCRGKVPSRRDDMEALALMLIHLLTPRGLSWTRNGIPKTDDAHERLKREKRNARPEDLCRGFPPEFEEFLRYCRRLNFHDEPDYGRWIKQFRTLAMESGFPEEDDFIWPPPTPAPVIPKAVAKDMARDTVLAVLEGLKNLNLDTNLVHLEGKSSDKIPSRDNGGSAVSDDNSVIEISSGSQEELAPQKPMIPKRVRLVKLTKRAAAGADNTQLSELVLEFIQVLQSNSSRTLTKEAFDFLDALYKQLVDPSVFIIPLRTSRSRSSNTSIEESEPLHVKRGTIARLRRDVRTVSSNRKLAEMVAEFGKVTNRSSGRTITKDGYGFLAGLGDRLLELGGRDG
ncbi:hypothetical protein AX15_000114 [Amanita polypyramis BW_CC]|nr:hypothetical protein AX15_000114 [Amanita polypyramis BW_CC]